MSRAASQVLALDLSRGMFLNKGKGGVAHKARADFPREFKEAIRKKDGFCEKWSKQSGEEADVEQERRHGRG